MDQAELARILRRSEAWCERARWSGTGPCFIKVGRKPFYRLADVEEWLQSQTRTSTSDRGPILAGARHGQR
ncbi:MAG: helix-turn-helix transcriptional regulator [Acidiferrobacteraceae bacterium]